MTTSMIITLRVFLIAGAVLVLAAVATRIRAKRVQMQDAIFWIVIASLLVLSAIFPRVIYSISDLLGFMSPSNLVFLVMIALLFVKSFIDACEISILKHRVNQLSEELALSDAEADEVRAAHELERHALDAHVQIRAEQLAQAAALRDGANGAEESQLADAPAAAQADVPAPAPASSAVPSAPAPAPSAAEDSPDD